MALALLPPLVAVTIAPPGATPVTTPVRETAATLGASLLHSTSRPVMGVPLMPVAIAFNRTVAPGAIRACPGSISSVATSETAKTALPVPLLLLAALGGVSVDGSGAGSGISVMGT
jgi:hypothetical protein